MDRSCLLKPIFLIASETAFQLLDAFPDADQNPPRMNNATIAERDSISTLTSVKRIDAGVTT
jgi:hypothetical protein